MKLLKIVNRILEGLFPDFVWRVKTKEKILFLTFDDGPVPVYTDFVLDQLKSYNAKATFFVVGDNVSKYPEQFLKILSLDHKVGNHTYNHLNGWKVPSDQYLDNFKKCESEISKKIETDMFRPPYGKISKNQSKFILKTHKVVMWSVLTRDYDEGLSKEKCLKNAIIETEPGSIIVFHDSAKAWKNLEYVLPRYLEHFSKKDYIFESL